MITTIPVSKDLFVVEQKIKTKTVIKKREKVNHIWIYDRSGSMHYDLPYLTQQLISEIKSVLVFQPRVEILPPNTIPETGLKAKRVIDERTRV